MNRHLIFILLLGFSISSQAKNLDEGFLNVAGAVIVGDRPVGGAEIVVYRGNEIVETHLTNRRGTFSVDLPLNQNYILSFSSAGMITKRILFNTQVPRQVGNNEFFYFEFILDLFEEVPWVDKTIFEGPIISISYDGQTEEFTYQSDEHRAIRAQLDAINKVRERIYRMNRQHRELLVLSEANYLRRDYNTAHTQLSEVVAAHSRDTFLLKRLSVVELAIERQKREEAEALARANMPKPDNLTIPIPAMEDPIPEPTPITPQAIPITPQPVTPAPQIAHIVPEPVATAPQIVHIIPEPVAPAPQIVHIVPEPVAPAPQVVHLIPESVAPKPQLAEAATAAPTRVERNVATQPPLPRIESDTQVAAGEIIFRSALAPYQRLEISDNVIFMVQVLAMSGKPRASFFAPIVDNMQGHQIVHYQDLDGLNKFGVGTYANINQAMETVRTLRNLGYDTFIVAFVNGRRVRVSEAKAY